MEILTVVDSNYGSTIHPVAKVSEEVNRKCHL